MKHQEKDEASMGPAPKQKRFTLSLPSSVHTELANIAAEKEVSLKDVVIQSLKIGMIAFEAENSPNKELIIREALDDGESKETRLIII